MSAESSKRFMQPIPPHVVLHLIESGFPADLVLTLCVRAVNGLQNATGLQAEGAPADTDFVRLVGLLRKVQRKGALGMRVERGEDEGRETTTIYFRSHGVDAESAEAIGEIRRLLGLDADRESFAVRYGSDRSEGDSVIVLTRSVLSVMFELARQIDVPAEHAEKGWTLPAASLGSAVDGPLMRVHAGSEEPRDAFVRVRYEDNWFWIRKDDLTAKRTFSFVGLIVSIIETGAGPPPTLVAVPG